MSERHLADRILPVLVAVIAAVGVTLTVTRLSYFTYDEGVYFHQAAEWARGRTPYTDFFVPQPPGILCLGCVAEKVGAGVGGVRAVTLLCGLILLCQTYRLARRISGPAAWAAVGFLASSAEWNYVTLEAATQTPTTVLILLAVELMQRNRLTWAGVAIGFATVFRIQAMTLLPGLGLAVLVRDGWRIGLIGNLKLANAVVVAGAIHGPLIALLSGYWEGVFAFQFDRPRMAWASRVEVLSETFGQPAVLFGLLAAVGVALKNGPLRPLGVLGLTTTAVTAFSGNSLFRPYFLAALPVLAVCGAAVVNELLERFRHPPRAWAVVAVLTVASGIGAIRLHAGLDRNRESHLRFLAEIRHTDARVWLTTDGRLMEISGKRMVTDFFATDPGGLFVRDPQRFQLWFREMLAQADAVAVTDLLARMLDAESATAVLASGKPTAYESKDGRGLLHDLAGRPPLPR